MDEKCALPKIKKEKLNDEIKEYAENAMNELLGLYGYGNPKDENRTTRCKSDSSGPESPKFSEGCGWCGKTVDDTNALPSASASFCSELCFAQSRRANFKKNKTCDWCRHVRNTVSFIESQDGNSQLQFCSDKCLNQYKMHIFWRETREHLELHPHVETNSGSNLGSAAPGTLITPDLWLAKSPDIGLEALARDRPQTSPLPLITVAHPSKLMASPESEVTGRRSRQKPPRRLQHPRRRCATEEMPQDLRVRPDAPTDSGDVRRRPEASAGGRRLPDGIVPPPTLLVPYPIVLPIPIPIPLPLPVPEYLLRKRTLVEAACQTETTDDKEIIDDTNDCTKNGNSLRPLRKRKLVFDARISKKRTVTS